MAKITILGTGTWGTALARLLANNSHEVCAWSKLVDELETLKTTNVHPKLKNVVLPQSIRYEKDLSLACRDAQIVVMAVPSPFVRSVAREASPYISNQIVVDVAKGIEKDSCKMLSEVIKEELPSAKVVVLSGPTHAEEVAVDLPTTIVSASADALAAEEVQKVFSSKTFRVYTNDDVVGVEMCGALKNIIALATGISQGLGYGDNAKAAIMTRGVAEIKRLGSKMGCKSSTFAGLAGIGDLVVTCTSMHSRNNKAGMLLGKGYSAQEAIKEVGMVVEGINALDAAMQLSQKYGIELPIISAVNDIVLGKLLPKDAIRILMQRELTNE